METMRWAHVKVYTTMCMSVCTYVCVCGELWEGVRTKQLCSCVSCRVNGRNQFLYKTVCTNDEYLHSSYLCSHSGRSFYSFSYCKQN